MLNSYVDLNFEVIKRADISTCANGNDIRLVNLGPIAFFSYLEPTTPSGKHPEDISHAHIVSLMYKILTSAKNTDALSIRFDRDRGRRRDDLKNKKNMKRKYHLRIMLKDGFGFAEHQEKLHLAQDIIKH